MTRLEYNKQILEILQKEVENNSQYRFIQLLWKLGIVDSRDRFHEESKETYDYIFIKEKYYG